MRIQNVIYGFVVFLQNRVYLMRENGRFGNTRTMRRLSGYNGKEKYIDLNVFYGNEEEFENYGMKD